MKWFREWKRSSSIHVNLIELETNEFLVGSLIFRRFPTNLFPVDRGNKQKPAIIAFPVGRCALPCCSRN